MRFFVLFLFSFVLNAVDYDCVFIGSSPISLCEALYHSYLGKRVLILEQSAECGGAWKSINICGIPHVDMGCHDVTWSDRNLSDFFESYLGCRIVSFTNPQASSEKMSGSFWFSGGCHELISNILNLIFQSSVDLRINHHVERVTLDPIQDCAIISIEGKSLLTTKKLYTTPLSVFAINQQTVPLHCRKYYHLYLLLQDPSPPKFISTSFNNVPSSRMMNLPLPNDPNKQPPRVSRMMNLTHSSDLLNTGRQLIVVQTCSENDPHQAEVLLQQLKEKNLVDPSAYLLRSESYIFEATYGSVNFHQLSPQERSYFEVLDTGSLAGMSSYLAKWKQVFKPGAVKQAMGD